MLRKLILALSVLFMLTTAAAADCNTDIFGPGQVGANTGAADGNCSPSNVSPLLDRVFGTTTNSMLFRNTTQWVAAVVSGDFTIAATGVGTLASVISAGGPIGSASTTPVITFDAKGRLTVVSSATITPAAIGAVAVGAAAGGDLTGTYPNPTLAGIITAGGPIGSATVTPVVTWDAKGRLTVVGSATIAPPFSAVTGSLACSQEPAFTGDVTTSAGSCANTLATVNANVGTFGSSTQCTTFTVNAKGLITAASQTACANSGTMTSVTAGTNTTAKPGAGIVLSTDPCTVSCAVALNVAYLQRYIAGLLTSNDGVSPNTVIDVAAGTAASDDNTTLMLLASAFTKNMNAAWAVGTGNGCADGAGGYTTLAASTTYFVFLIIRPDTGVVDLLCSKSATSPTQPLVNYTKQRRIGAVMTDGASHIIAFSQQGNTFLLKSQTQNRAGTALGVTTAVLQAVSVPIGIQVTVNVTILDQWVTSGFYLYVSSPDQTDVAASSSSFTVVTNSTTTQAASTLQIRTDVSGNIRMRADNTTHTVFVDTNGWIDNL